jgi:phosphatidylglycerophosphate synthase
VPQIDVKRDPSPFAPVAARLAEAIEPRVPAGVTPNAVTAVAFGAQLLGAAGLYLAGRHPAWFLLGIGGLLLHWLLDALDGTLASRREMRSESGFFLDLFLDACGLAVVVLAVGASSYAYLPLWAAYAALILLRGHLFLHEVYLTRRFIIPFPSQGEAPFVLALLALVYVLLAPSVTVAGWALGVFDLAGIAFALGLALELVRGALGLFGELRRNA